MGGAGRARSGVPGSVSERGADDLKAEAAHLSDRRGRASRIRQLGHQSAVRADLGKRRAAVVAIRTERPPAQRQLRLKRIGSYWTVFPGSGAITSGAVERAALSVTVRAINVTIE